MSQAKMLSKLESDSLRVFAETRMVHLDSLENPEIEQTYLTIDGTPEAYRWLAYLLNQMAANAESSENGGSVIVSPSDLSRRPITMSQWSSLELCCRRKTANR